MGHSSAPAGPEGTYRIEGAEGDIAVADIESFHSLTYSFSISYLCVLA